MSVRMDGSVESANTPSYGDANIRNYCIYRCMISKLFYVDDINNPSKGSKNPQVTYEAIIVGGTEDGKSITNLRDAMKMMGGFNNYDEVVLRKADKSFKLDNPNSSSPSAQNGDIVYVAFLDGNPLFPIIIGRGTHPLDTTQTGASSADGPIKRSQYNGVFEQIDKNGNYVLTRKGGSFDPQSLIFTQNDSGNEAQLALKDTAVVLTGANGATLKADNDKIALGTSAVELLQQISDQLQKLSDFLNNVDSTHTHLGNLGYPTAPPTQAAGFTQLGSDLATIKGKVDSIKGTI